MILQERFMTKETWSSQPALHSGCIEASARPQTHEPRAAPTRPRPLDFPHFQVHGEVNAVHHARDLIHLFACQEKRISTKHVEALNITLEEGVPLDRIVPESYLPPSSWLQNPSTTSSTTPSSQPSSKLSNGVPVPTHRDFYARASELLHPNDPVFDSLSYRPSGGPRAPPSSQAIRLTHTHKFYQHLVLLAEYWDASKDEYIPSPQNPQEYKYTGRRYGAGHELPPRYRDDLIAAFTELCIWPFRCNLQSPNCHLSRKLKLQDRILPIQGVSSAVCASSTVRQKARKGILEGPLMGIHCRNTTVFRNESERVGEGREEVLDLLFEVGAAVLVAQKRAREGKGEERAGEGKFWVSAARRHLGEMGGGRQDRESNAWARWLIMKEKEAVGGGGGGKEDAGVGEPMEGVDMGRDGEGGAMAGAKRRKVGRTLGVQAYLDARPGEGLWEAKVEYRMIGKAPGAGVDNIFLISALNHHISILSILVPDAYLDYITKGSPTPHSPPSPSASSGAHSPGFEKWWKLEVRRSKWYDLLVPGERAEAMRGVWGACCWGMRGLETDR
ncbi:hypothetical protein Q9189_007402 [Teloschistes chrysophthalmus]